jgi:hypothetical protein
MNKRKPPARNRATKTELAERRSAIYRMVAKKQLLTVRQCFEHCQAKGIIEPTDPYGYHKVQRVLSELRRSDEMPFACVDRR